MEPPRPAGRWFEHRPADPPARRWVGAAAGGGRELHLIGEFVVIEGSLDQAGDRCRQDPERGQQRAGRMPRIREPQLDNFDPRLDPLDMVTVERVPVIEDDIYLAPSAGETVDQIMPN